MIKFIIVEDEKEYQDIYKNIIDKIMFKNDNNYEIQPMKDIRQSLNLL